MNENNKGRPMGSKNKGDNVKIMIDNIVTVLEIESKLYLDDKVVLLSVILFKVNEVMKENRKLRGEDNE